MAPGSSRERSGVYNTIISTDTVNIRIIYESSEKGVIPGSPDAGPKALNQTDWYAIPDRNDRVTTYRAAKEKITARVLADLATEQARQAAEQAREAAAVLARLPNAGGRYGQ